VVERACAPPSQIALETPAALGQSLAVEIQARVQSGTEDATEDAMQQPAAKSPDTARDPLHHTHKMSTKFRGNHRSPAWCQIIDHLRGAIDRAEVQGDRAEVQGDVRDRGRSHGRARNGVQAPRAKERGRVGRDCAETAMIRKLKSGGYRLYSRKTDPRDRAGDAISVPSRPEPQPRSMSTTRSISSATEADPHSGLSAESRGPGCYYC
jgi:hypothetical protein